MCFIVCFLVVQDLYELKCVCPFGSTVFACCSTCVFSIVQDMYMYVYHCVCQDLLSVLIDSPVGHRMKTASFCSMYACRKTTRYHRLCYIISPSVATD